LKSLLSCAAVLLLVSLPSVAEIHEKVQAALGYAVPENPCDKPNSYARSVSVSGAPTQAAGSALIFEGQGAQEISDVDSYTLRRQERKSERFEKCVATYKEGLLEDMEELKMSAQHGLTQDQAITIVGKMAEIQKVYMTPEGVVVADE
jgi:hypothetical protein